jgi:hypothetical protein
MRRRRRRKRRKRKKRRRRRRRKRKRRRRKRNNEERSENSKEKLKCPDFSKGQEQPPGLRGRVLFPSTIAGKQFQNLDSKPSPTPAHPYSCPP